jgi:aldehyde dehydrogenase (NAD+)
MLRLAGWLEAAADRMAVADSTGNGKAIRETHRPDGLCRPRLPVLRRTGRQADRTDHPGRHEGRRRRHPARAEGVCVRIAAWSPPISLPADTLAPALAAGNGAVVKPSEHAPVTTPVCADPVREAGLPPGVVNIVIGDHRVGAALLRSGRLGPARVQLSRHRRRAPGPHP